MLEHYIQKNIVYALALTQSLRFSDLKPDTIENKLFDYHLKKVVAQGYVTKLDSGEYALTPTGRRVGKDVIKHADQLVDRAYSVLFLAVRRQSDNAWLLCRRKTHPLLGAIGFMHTQPGHEHHAADVAASTLLEKSGLHGDFVVRGSGYLRMYESDNLESFTHFTLLESKVMEDTIEQRDPLAEYFWEATPDFTDKDMLPSIAGLCDALEKPGLFYFEADFRQLQ